jgi:hypothetical protein
VNNDTASPKGTRAWTQERNAMDVIFKMRITLSRLNICKMPTTYGNWGPFARKWYI